MAWEMPDFSFTLPAGLDLSASQFCFVNTDTTAAGVRAILPLINGRAIGVLQNKPNAAGIAATIVSSGITKARVGAAGVTAGDTLKVDAAGKVVTANAASYAVGIALETGAAGVLIPVLLTPSGGGGLIA